MRTRVLGIAVLAAACSDPEPGFERDPEALVGSRPNIVLLLTDDQRHDTLGCTGASFMPTPNLDWLAERGVVFDDATVTSARCCPSRASILTGKYAHATGILNNQPEEGALDDDVTFPELLQASGYTTAFVGKWHITNPGAAPRAGFDHWVSFERQGEYFNQPLNVNGEEVETKGFSADVLARRAAEWLGEEREGPFFLMLSLKNCHTPFSPPLRHRTRLLQAPIELPASLGDDPANLTEHWRSQVRSGQSIAAELDPAALVKEKRRYLQLVLSVDSALNTVLAALSKTQALRSTLIAFTSDNGFLFGEHGMLSKATTHEPALRVPLIVAWPGVLPTGRRVSAPALNVDLAPTFLELAGVPIPAGVQGRSLLPVLVDGDAAGWREMSLHHEPLREGADHPREFALRKGRWKYVAMTSAGLEEVLYDLERDPDERENLASDPDHAETLAALRSDLRGEMERLDVPEPWFDGLRP